MSQLPRTTSSHDWTQIRRRQLPDGDALYTIRKIGESALESDEDAAEMETILVDGFEECDGSWPQGTSRTITTPNLLPPNTQLSTIQKRLPMEDQSLSTPGEDFDIITVPEMVERWTQHSLDYWKYRLGVMEEHKRHIRELMEKTTLKISESVKRMKICTSQIEENLREMSSADSDLDDDAEHLQNIDFAPGSFATVPLSSVNHLSPKGADGLAKSEDICEDAKDAGGEDGNNCSAQFEEQDRTPLKEFEVCTYGYLTLKQFPAKIQESEALVKTLINSEVLNAMDFLGEKDWQQVKTLYMVLKRVGRIDQLLVYDLSRSIIEDNMSEENKLDSFLNLIDTDASSAIFKFGCTLLTLYHTSVLMNGEITKLDKEDLDLFPQLKERLGRIRYDPNYRVNSRNCRAPTTNRSKAAVERILQRQREKLQQMYFRCQKQNYASLPNPQYAHVKSRYMDALHTKRDEALKSRSQLRQTSSRASQSPKNEKPSQARPRVRILSRCDKSKTAKCKVQCSQSREKWEEVEKDTAGTSQQITVIAAERSIEQLDSPPKSSSSSSSQGNDGSACTVLKQKISFSRHSPTAYRSAHDNVEDFTLVPSNSTETMSIASEIVADLAKNVVPPTKSYIVECFSLDVKPESTSNDLSHGDSTKICTQRDQSPTRYNKTKHTIKNRNVNSTPPIWKLVSIPSANQEGRNEDNSVGVSLSTDSQVLSSYKSLSMSQASATKSRSNKANYSLIVLAKDKYVSVNLNQKQPLSKEKCPSIYDLAEGMEDGSIVHMLYRNLPSLRPLIVDVLLTNIVVAYLVAITGEAFSNPQRSIICNISAALKDKLRTILIRALHLVDGF